MRYFISTVCMTLVAFAGLMGGSINSSTPGWVSFNQADASPYRRSVRRTSRRTSRRVSRRHSGYYGGGAVVAGAAVIGVIALGTVVATLPPACNTVIVNGVSYHNCSGTYYAPSGPQYIVVDEPY